MHGADVLADHGIDNDQRQRQRVLSLFHAKVGTLALSLPPATSSSAGFVCGYRIAR
jgi:hypothetical protein